MSTIGMRFKSGWIRFADVVDAMSNVKEKWRKI